MAARLTKPIFSDLHGEWAMTVATGVTPEMWQWCRDNCQGKFMHITFTAFFDNQHDADMFYLTFA